MAVEKPFATYKLDCGGREGGCKKMHLLTSSINPLVIAA